MATSHDQPFRHYLKEWREHRKMLQADLAKLVGTAASVISRYETGDRRIHLEMQFRLMQALRITPAQFFSPPDAPSLDAIVAGETLEERRRIGNLVKAYLARDDTK
jgi:transcriptional regulator with XRE-family HTH domain